MKERPYHHLPDGTFRNPKGSPVIISRSGKFSYRTFSKLRKKVDLSYPKEHVIEKQKVLADLEKYKHNNYIAWIGHATYLIKLGGITIITDPVFSKNAGPLIFGPKRFTNPAIKLNEIPKTDISVLGISFNFIAGLVNLFGPKISGPAFLENTGSVIIVIPPNFIRYVAWPIQAI